MRSIFGRSYMGDFFAAMAARIEQREQEERNREAGIIENEGVYGVPSKNIELMFDMLDFNGRFYLGRANEMDYVFDAAGKFLFSADKYGE